MKWLSEPVRQTPVAPRCQVLVAGGGPAGFAAALQAARHGASVRLIETQGQIGGIWTSGLLAWILDAGNKPGLMAELLTRLADHQPLPAGHHGGQAADVETMKVVLEEMLQQARVAIRLHTRVVAAIVDPSKRLTHVVTESKSGREAWPADVFIDCTGDGDLAALAGCRFEIGQPPTGRMQPFSMVGYLAGPSIQEIQPFLHIAENLWPSDGDRILQALAGVGVEPSYRHPLLLPVSDGLYLLMANHEYGVSAIDAQDVTDATLRGRAEVHRLVAGFHRLGGAWTKLKLVATASQIGTREGRRIAGRYSLTQADLVQGARFEDAVCRVTFPVDIHSPDPKSDKGFLSHGVRSQPYDIPLRSLIAKDVDGLMMAGRCISGDFIAHASYRVTGNAVAMGQAAGRVAAASVRQNRWPHEVAWPEGTSTGIGPEQAEIA